VGAQPRPAAARRAARSQESRKEVLKGLKDLFPLPSFWSPKRPRGLCGLTTSPSRETFCRMSGTFPRTFRYLNRDVSVSPRLPLLGRSWQRALLVAGFLGSLEWFYHCHLSSSNSGIAELAQNPIPLKNGILRLVETGPVFRLDQDQDLSTYSLLGKTRNHTHDRTFILFTPWPTRRFAFALVVCFPKVTPSSPSGGLAYPPQLLLRALTGPDEGLDE